MKVELKEAALPPPKITVCACRTGLMGAAFWSGLGSKWYDPPHGGKDKWLQIQLLLHQE